MAFLLLRHSALVTRIAPPQLARGIAASSVARKDLVQELYLREIKGYKAPPTPKDAHVGSVKTFNAPVTPQPPLLPSNFASELASYDAMEPASPAASSAPPSATSEPTGGAQQFLEFLEQDHPKEEEAHH